MAGKVIVFAALLVLPRLAVAEESLAVGMAAADITPDIQSRPVWMAGFSQGRQAETVHDPLYARAVVLKHGDRKLALVSVDLIGLQLPAVQRVRAKLAGFMYVLISSTHTHHGPDVIGLWGPGPFKSGVDPEYIDLVVERVVAAVHEAEKQAVPVRAHYGTIKADELLHDSRLPKAVDGVLRVLAFRRDDDRLSGILVQWNCHPEVMGRSNPSVTADFPFATIAALTSKYGCPVAYFSGALGGLMTPPGDLYRDGAGQPLADGTFEYTERYGRDVAEKTSRAVDAAKAIELVPFEVATKPIALPLANQAYQMARSFGVLDREAHVWTGDAEQLGPIASGQPETRGKTLAVESEVACLRMGELYLAAIPGELYPELVYGEYPPKAEAGVDFPDAPLETPVAKLLASRKLMLFGLANDEIGYIIPKRQWDQLPPYAYGRDKSQYGEINSCGPEVAPIIMRALERRIAELKPPAEAGHDK